MDTLPMDTSEGTMKTTNDFLDDVKAARGLTSDYQLSKLLECTHSSISNYRMGKNFLSEEMACKIASILGLESGFVLACVAAERSKLPEVKKAWQHLADMLTSKHGASIAAALALFLILPTVAMDNHENAAFSGLDNPDTVYYVKLLAELFSAYWLALLPLCLLALRYFPRYTPRPKKQQN